MSNLNEKQSCRAPQSKIKMSPHTVGIMALILSLTYTCPFCTSLIQNKHLATNNLHHIKIDTDYTVMIQCQLFCF